MSDSIRASDLNAHEPERGSNQGAEYLAEYRADRDDFSRLLYLLFQEIRARQATVATKPADQPQGGSDE